MVNEICKLKLFDGDWIIVEFGKIVRIECACDLYDNEWFNCFSADKLVYSINAKFVVRVEYK
jgi:hypothetical protein